MKKYLEDFYAKERDVNRLKLFWSEFDEVIKYLRIDELFKIEEVSLKERIRRYAIKDRDNEVNRLILLAGSFDEFVRFCAVSSIDGVSHFQVEELQDMWQEFMDGKAGDNEK